MVLIYWFIDALQALSHVPPVKCWTDCSNLSSLCSDIYKLTDYPQGGALSLVNLCHVLYDTSDLKKVFSAQSVKHQQVFMTYKENTFKVILVLFCLVHYNTYFE